MSEPFQGHREGVTEGHGIAAGQGDPLTVAAIPVIWILMLPMLIIVFSIDALDSADGAVTDLERMDGRARERVDLEQPLMASDLIFTDGLELAARASTNVELARATERTTRNETIRAARSSQATMIATALGVSGLAVLLLIPMKRAEGPAPFESIDAEKTEAVLTDELGLSVEDPKMLDTLDLNAVDPSPAAPDTAPGPAADSLEPVPDLRVAADLCTDLCTVTDTSELPELLARAATLMNATGIIIWVRDSSGHALRPALGHGYPTRTLTRLGTIPEDGSNATAAAYRSARGLAPPPAGAAPATRRSARVREPRRCIGLTPTPGDRRSRPGPCRGKASHRRGSSRS